MLREPPELEGADLMIFIADSKSLSPTKCSVCSPEFVRRYTERRFGAGAGAGAGLGAAFFAGAFLGAAFLGAAFFGAAFFGAAFFLAGAFFVAALGAAVFFVVGMSPPIALKVSITGCHETWFDTGWGNSIV